MISQAQLRQVSSLFLCLCGETGTRHEPPEDWVLRELGTAHQSGAPVLPLEPDQEDRESGNTSDFERAGAV